MGYRSPRSLVLVVALYISEMASAAAQRYLSFRLAVDRTNYQGVFAHNT